LDFYKATFPIFEAQTNTSILFLTMNIINKSRMYKNKYNNSTKNQNALKLEI